MNPTIIISGLKKGGVRVPGSGGFHGTAMLPVNLGNSEMPPRVPLDNQVTVPPTPVDVEEILAANGALRVRRPKED